MSTNYQDRVKREIERFKDKDNIHASLGAINSYWKKRHHTPRFYRALGVHTPQEFYANYFFRSGNQSSRFVFASIGSGDGAVEASVAKKLEEMGLYDYVFHLYELSPFKNEKASANVKKLGLRGSFVFYEANANEWAPACTYSGIMAHHSLHHIQELEHLFDQIKASLDDCGSFVTCDMIGRNGHQRWPETYAIINALWHFLPEEKRIHSVFGWKDSNFRDLDCSSQDFEGIRAQDILRLLVERFDFESFFSWGGLTDVFTGRSYGHNFSPECSEDCRFIDLVDELNEILLDLGAIKPTVACAAMVKPKAKPCAVYRNRFPESMIRNPNASCPGNIGC